MAVSKRMWQREQERKRRERIRRARRRRNCAVAVVILAVAAVIAIVMLNKDTDKPKTPKSTPAVEVKTDTTAVTNPYTTTRTEDDIKLSFYKNTAFAGNALAKTVGMYGILEETDIYADVNTELENVDTAIPQDATTPIAEQFKSKRFNKLFLCFGENELNKLSATEFKDQYAELVGKIKENQPDTTIYVLGIPPVSANTSELNSNITMSKIKSFNKRIISLAVDEELYYVDCVDALGDNKDFLPQGVSADGVNLNKAAVIDLLYYIQKEAYIPDSSDLADTGDGEEDDKEDDEEDDEKDEPTSEPTDKPDKTSAPTASPTPTVNVLKDKKSKGDN